MARNQGPTVRRHAPVIVSLLLAISLWFVCGAEAEPETNSQWIAFNRAGAPGGDLQCFTSGNVSVSDGNLVLLTKAETATCSSFDLSSASHNYTSAFVMMRTFSFLYGTVEFRAKFGGGAGSGAWPAVWMADVSCHASDPTGTDDRCNEQEIDIAEILNSDFTHVNQQIHVDRFTHNDGCKAPTSDASDNFHVYQLVWAPGSLVFKIDGTTTCTIAQSYVPNTPMYLKMTAFVGGFGGNVNNSSLPWKTVIDYVKVTQGSVVAFNDDFSHASTIEPGHAAHHNRSFGWDFVQQALPKRRLHRLLFVLAIGVVVTFAGLVLSRIGG
jgi:beta-glucanase (GH16 family)